MAKAKGTKASTSNELKSIAETLSSGAQKISDVCCVIEDVARGQAQFPEATCGVAYAALSQERDELQALADHVRALATEVQS